MPILDYDDEFTLSQNATTKGQLITVTAIGGRQKGVIGSPRDWAAGSPRFAYFAVTPAANSNPGTSMTVDIVGSDDIALSVNPVVLSTRTVPVAQLLAGRSFGMPSLSAGSRRAILGARFTVTGAAATTGAYTCGLVRGNARPQDGFINW